MRDVTEEDIRQFEQLQKRNCEALHGSLAVEIARINQILLEDSNTWETRCEDNVAVATEDDLKDLQGWKKELEENMQKEADILQDEYQSNQNRDGPDVVPLEELLLGDHDMTVSV